MGKNTLVQTKTDETEIELIKYFKQEEQELNNAIKEIDDLYDEVKEHYDKLKLASRNGNAGRGVLTFIQNQTGNLVSLKNSKASLIKDKITMKKYEAELALKQKKDEDDSKVNNEIINAIMEKLEKNNEDVIIDETYDEDYDDNSVSPDELLERRLNELKASGKIQDDEEDEVQDEGTLAVYVKDKKWKFIGINEYGKIIKNFPVPNKKDYKMKLHKEEDGSYTATDQNDKVYKVIKAKKK